MKFYQLVLVVVLSCLTAFSTAYFVSKKTETVSAEKETRWEQVKKRGTLRCGYFVWPPMTEKDLDTGKVKGIFPEIIEEMAHQMKLEVEWTAEVDRLHMFSGYNKYDMICTPLIRNGSRARETRFTVPLSYLGLYLFVRADDNRFERNIEALNNPDVRIAVVDGSYSSMLVREVFPKAKTIPLTQLSSGAELILQVSTNKADATITDSFSGQAFIENNPGKIKIASDEPVRVLGFSFATPPHESFFGEVVDATLSNLIDIGFLDKTYKKYEKGVGRLVRVARPYDDSVISSSGSGQ